MFLVQYHTFITISQILFWYKIVLKLKKNLTK